MHSVAFQGRDSSATRLSKVRAVRPRGQGAPSSGGGGTGAKDTGEQPQGGEARAGRPVTPCLTGHVSCGLPRRRRAPLGGQVSAL